MALHGGSLPATDRRNVASFRWHAATRHLQQAQRGHVMPQQAQRTSPAIVAKSSCACCALHACTGAEQQRQANLMWRVLELPIAAAVGRWELPPKLACPQAWRPPAMCNLVQMMPTCPLQ